MVITRWRGNHKTKAKLYSFIFPYQCQGGRAKKHFARPTKERLWA